jgi:hypothetical protein
MSKKTFPDDTLNWALDGGKRVKPGLVLSVATEANYISRRRAVIPNYHLSTEVDTKALLNCASPGMQLLGVLHWSVNESLDTLTSSATVELLNALPVSQITTTLTSDLPGQFHDPNILWSYYRDPKGQTAAEPPPQPNPYDPTSLLVAARMHESQIIVREFRSESFTVSSTAGFPGAGVPITESEEPSVFRNYRRDDVGAYFLLIDNEVVRVTKTNDSGFVIPPGGRGVNGIIESHTSGATVHLLGFGPPTGEWTAQGYLTQREFAPQTSLLRPGMCLASYEGFGNFNNGNLTKASWSQNDPRRYDFTGYWFVKGQESTLTTDGIPKCTIELASAGHILEEQKITSDAVRALGQSGDSKHSTYLKDAFNRAGSQRDIPGDWVDYNSWDPTLPSSVPLQIKTEYAQHKAFFDHMQSTTNGKDCEFCKDEWLHYINGYQGSAAHAVGLDPIAETRAVGKHVYKQSIRVMNDSADGKNSPGPIKTYGRLMVELAKIMWEMPTVGGSVETGARALADAPYGTDGPRWTKMPSVLWANMRQYQSTGLVWKQTLRFNPISSTTHLTVSPAEIRSQLNITDELGASLVTQPLMCPFESSYDKQPWSQPIKDLADVNRMTFMFNRQGFPVLAPRGLRLRGISGTDAYNPGNFVAASTPVNIDSANTCPRPGGADGNWHLSWGKTISAYNYNFKPETALTKVYVTGTDAFDEAFTLTSAGTGIDPTGKLVWYSGVVGNAEVLQYTGGVQQVDTMSLDNLKLGLEWDTAPAGNWSLKLNRGTDGTIEVSKRPIVPKMLGKNTLSYKSKKNSKAQVKELQQTYNFLRVRFYINAAPLSATPKTVEYIETITEDGIFGLKTQAAVFEMQRFLKSKSLDAFAEFGGKSATANYSLAHKLKVDGEWSAAEYFALESWLTKNAEYIKKDVWWYVLGGYDWNYYIGAITGLAIPQRKGPSTGSGKSKSATNWVTDLTAFKSALATEQTKYYIQVLNFGNEMLHDAANKATVRTITAALADPRICLGDVIYADIPGHVEQVAPETGSLVPSSTENSSNATFITQLNREMDLAAGTYTGSYSGYRYQISNELERQRINSTNYWNY